MQGNLILTFSMKTMILIATIHEEVKRSAQLAIFKLYLPWKHKRSGEGPLNTMNSHHGSEVSTTSSFHFPRNSRGENLYVYGAPGVNFFLRVGAIGILQIHFVIFSSL